MKSLKRKAMTMLLVTLLITSITSLRAEDCKVKVTPTTDNEFVVNRCFIDKVDLLRGQKENYENILKNNFMLTPQFVIGGLTISIGLGITIGFLFKD